MSRVPAWLRKTLGFIGSSKAFVATGRLVSGYQDGLILGYHNLPARQFIEQMEAFPGFKIVPLSEMVARVRRGGSTAGRLTITVDDGVGTTVRALASVALERQWPVTFYLPTQYLDDPNSAIHMLWTNISIHLPLGRLETSAGTYELTDSEKRAKFLRAMRKRLHTRPIREYARLFLEIRDLLVASGAATLEQLNPPAPIRWEEVAAYAKSDLLDFQSHGVTHEAASVADPAQFEWELRFSQAKISEATGKSCRHFCYPFGGSGSIGAMAPMLAGRYYDSGVTMTRGRVGKKEPMLLPRVAIQEHDSAGLARLKALTI